jgi:hypothetical protein
MSPTSSTDELTEWMSAWVKGITSLFIDPWQLLQDLEGGGGTIRSQVFSATSSAISSRTLELADDLIPGIGRPKHPDEAIPADAVRFEPPVLAAGETSFRLLVDADSVEDHPGGTYWGTVTVSESAGPLGIGIFAATESVSVWIVVP